MIFKGPPAQMRPRAKTPVFLTKHSTIITKKNWVDHRQSQTCFFFSTTEGSPVPRPTWNLGHSCQAGNQTRQREACGEGDVINFFSVLTAHWDQFEIYFMLDARYYEFFCFCLLKRWKVK